MHIVTRSIVAILNYLSDICTTAAAGLFGMGLVLGITAVSMWQQWSLTFGYDPTLLIALSLVMAAALLVGHRWQASRIELSRTRTLTYVGCCLAGWSLLYPFWVETLATLMGSIPLNWLENSVMATILAFALACLGWSIPGILWAAIFTQVSSRNSTFQSSIDSQGQSTQSEIANQRPRSFAESILLCGIVGGLLLNSVLLSPWIGVFNPTLIACVMMLVIGLYIRSKSTEIPMPRHINEMTFDSFESITLRAAMICLVGGLYACHLRLIDQLMPHGALVVFIQVSGVLLGIAAGVGFKPRGNSSSEFAAWGGLAAAVIATTLLAIHPWLVGMSLWMNSTLTSVSLLMIARMALLIATSLPFGIVFAWIANDSGKSATNRTIVWGAPLLIGIGVSTFVLGGTIKTVPLMAVCEVWLLASSALLRIRTSGFNFSIRTAAILSCLLLSALSLPIWRSNDDASRTAKILFSTPAFVAYRSGWKIDQLPALDEVRMIHRSEGPAGSMTLWRGRVAELFVREAGLPRSVISSNPEMVPQFPAEVLQAVYPMLLSDRPSRILFLGLSAGVPLSTCLGFPIQEAVCIEGNPCLIDLIRGPIAKATGYDPLSDDRVTLKRIAPELALMTEVTETFDVILSSPPSTAMTGGSASYTREYYQRAASRLSTTGLFCQRLECLDYGPEPLRIVARSMRQAFRRVIAIETAYGEILLFGANSDDIEISDEFAARLERPYVLKILARSGLDWSTLLNHPAYDHDALGELCEDSKYGTNSTFNGLLAAQTPLEVMRWGNKLQETQSALTATRLTNAPFWRVKPKGEPQKLDGDEEISLTRRSRLVQWLGDERMSLDLRRRLDEVTLQHKVIYENPDAHWWEYRKALKKELQDRPRTLVQQVKSIDEKRVTHPEDIRRRDYFVALGDAIDRRRTPTREQIATVEEYLEPYDPLVSFFARQEIADLLARCGGDDSREIAYRLYVIFFSPAQDSSVRNVATAIETLVSHSEAIPDPADRFDALNGLLQTLRSRWESRQTISQTSPKKVLEDIDQSLLAVEHGITALDVLAVTTISDSEWKTRKQVLDRLLSRPLRSYRDEVKARQTRNQAQVRAILENTSELEGEQGKSSP